MSIISLCMIAYNEENNIRRCLENVRGLVDEIIVVDTGSTDRTISVFQEYGAQVFDYKWAEDFSEARNYSISKASGEWILLLDADEELEMWNLEGLKQYLSDISCDLIPVHMIHFYGEAPADEKRAHFSNGLRLIRNNKDILFAGKIHERIDVNNKSIASASETRQFVRILHYGYMNGISESKLDRNLSMLLKERDRQPDDPWIGYCLAAEYYRSGRIAEAFHEVTTAIALFIGKRLKPPSLAYKLKYDMLVTSGYYDLACKGIEKALALYPDYVDLYFYKGVLQYKRGEYERAKNTFLYCFLLGETNVDYLILSGTGSFLALHYLGLCHEKQGEAEQANEAFRQAEELCRNQDPDKQQLNTIEVIIRSYL